MGKVDPIPATFCRVCGYCIHALPLPRCPECGTGFDLSDPKTFRRRPPRHLARRFVWVGVLLAVLSLPFVGGWGYFYYGWRQEQPAIAALTRCGLTVTTAAVGPRWLRACTPPQLAFVFERAASAEHTTYTGSVRVVRLDGDGMAAIGRLEHLRKLEAWLLRARADDDVRCIGRIDSLEVLWLVGAPVSDDALLSLGRLPKLRSLVIWCNASERAIDLLRERRPTLVIDTPGPDFVRANTWQTEGPIRVGSSATRP